MRCGIVTTVMALVMLGVACAEDWPQFRGPARDGISTETGLLQSWPEGGPTLVWKNDEIGDGWAGAAVVKGTVYTTGFVGEDFAVSALNPDGTTKWQKTLGAATGGGGHRGSRTTPTVDGENLYVFSDAGVLTCLATADGKTLWSVEVAREYGSRPPTWMFAESPLVDGNNVICTPGGRVSVVALDKNTRKEVWTSERVDGLTSYASARIIEYGGLRQVVTYSAKSVFGVDAATGRLLWKMPHDTKHDVNATSVVFSDGVLFAFSGYGTGGEAFNMTVTGKQVKMESKWKAPAPDDQMGGVALMEGKIYGTGHANRGLTVLDAGTGNVVYRKPNYDQSSVIWGDGRIYLQGYRGTVVLVDPATGDSTGSVRMPFRGGNMWAHPAISDGKLYIRHAGSLTCFDIKK